MWDPKRLNQVKSVVILREAPRPESDRPSVMPILPRQIVDPNREGPRWQLLRALGFKSYREYCSSQAWQLIRERILLRAEGLCESCHVRKAKIIHHLDYAWETLCGRNDAGLTAVCQTCHKAWHHKPKRRHRESFQLRRRKHWLRQLKANERYRKAWDSTPRLVKTEK